MIAALVGCGDDDPSDPSGGGGTDGASSSSSSVTAVTSATSSTGQGGEAAQVASVEIIAEGFCKFSCFHLDVGEERQLTAKVLDTNGDELSVPVAWSIEDEAIATIDQSGIATGVATGEVTVSATAGGVTGTAVLTVEPKTVVTIDVTPQHVTLPTIGDTQQFVAVAKDEDGNVIDDAPISWITANPGVAAIDGSGLLTSEAQGHVVVLAGSGFAQGWAEVTVVAPLSPEPPFSLEGVTGGGSHACGLTTAGVAYCWGWNYFGQLGNGQVGDEMSSEPRPVAVAGGLTFTELSTGLYHTCGITTAGLAYCWGLGDTGALGNGDDTVLGSPNALPVVGGHTFAKLAAGGSHTCGITPAGALYCWGGNFDGQLGVGTTQDSFAPVAVAPGTIFTDVALGLWNTCALTDTGAALCWGSNANGVLGSGSAAASEPSPVAVSGGHTFTSLDEYGSFVCAIDGDGALWCWGRNDTGQLGDGTLVDANIPVAVDTLDTFVSVATGGHHTCAVTTGGATRCWGDGAYGQLGHGILEQSSTAVDVLGGLAFERVIAGSHFACGEIAGGVYCWGDASTSQTGGGFGGPGALAAVPVPLAAPMP